MDKVIQRYTREALEQRAAAGETPEMLFFWRNSPDRNGGLGKGCLSQWWEAEFTHQGQVYCCMEQMMMASKARLFGDEEVLAEILACSDPALIKKLGRKVRNFDDAAWDEWKFTFIVQGNISKFTADAEMRDFLLSTGDCVLVEASPYDCIWGIGMTEDNPQASDPRQWRGKNLLGFALMQARDEIRSALARE